MSMEMIVSIVGVVITILTLGIMVRSGNKGLEQRLDARITANSKQIDKLDLKVDGVEASLTAKIDKLGVRVDGLEASLTAKIDKLDLKVDGVEVSLTAKIDKLGVRVDGVEASLAAKIDGVAHELSEFRLETKTTLARHDERLAAIERQRPHLLMP